MQWTLEAAPALTVLRLPPSLPPTDHAGSSDRQRVGVSIQTQSSSKIWRSVCVSVCLCHPCRDVCLVFCFVLLLLWGHLVLVVLLVRIEKEGVFIQELFWI